MIMARAIFIIIFIFAVLGFGVYFFTKSPKDDLQSYQLKTTTMKISSPAFENNKFIPADYTCDGKGLNPPLVISEIPAKTESLILIVDDPDAPGGTWVHWTVWNINPETKEISSPSVLAGATEGLTSIGKSGYRGPCPPSGTHRYFFKLYALDTKLNLPADTPKSGLLEAMANHILAEAELVGLYSRAK